jgi:hypothetical protein
MRTNPSIRDLARQIIAADSEITRSAAVRMAAAMPARINVADCEYYWHPDGSGRTVIVLPGWVADDGNAEVEYPHAATGREAAEEYVADGDWGDDGGYVDVSAWRVGIDGNGESVRVEEHSHIVDIETPEPECADGETHDWQSPFEVLGGIKENPGVWGNGGGVMIREVCAHCGRYRVTDTWANRGAEQGYTDVSYEDADESSMEWVDSLAESE